ncbi:hypothetical protein A1F99_007890 [Pyrenophora tritici-repentis]|nr:hypothetical protein A1F99_007890 [Pyrenophora tritici-repentis]
MSSNNYNQYSYPYQQSSAQPYSTYQTASASNNVAPAPRQYQQPPPTQAQDYMSYQPQLYANQNNGYATGQDNSWNGTNYGSTRETTSRAAEVLRNMSNPSYTNNNTAVTNQTAFTAGNATASHSGHYTTGNSHSPQVQAQPAYAQSQPRPRSVNTNRTQPASRGLPSPAMTAGYPSQRAQTIYNQQQQRSASPAQPQYNNVPASNTIATDNSLASTPRVALRTPHRRRPTTTATRKCLRAQSHNQRPLPLWLIHTVLKVPPP